MNEQEIEFNELILNYITMSYPKEIQLQVLEILTYVVDNGRYDELEYNILEIVLTDNEDTEVVIGNVNTLIYDVILDILIDKGIKLDKHKINFRYLTYVIETITNIEHYNEVNINPVLNLLSDDELDNESKLAKAIEMYTVCSWIEVYEIITHVSENYIYNLAKRLDNLEQSLVLNIELLGKHPELSNTNIGRLIVNSGDDTPTPDEFLGSLYDILALVGYNTETAVTELCAFIVMCVEVDDKLLFLDKTIREDIMSLTSDGLITDTLIRNTKDKLTTYVQGDN